MVSAWKANCLITARKLVLGRKIMSWFLDNGMRRTDSAASCNISSAFISLRVLYIVLAYLTDASFKVASCLLSTLKSVHPYNDFYCALYIGRDSERLPLVSFHCCMATSGKLTPR